MIIKLANWWVDRLVRASIDEDDREVYVYGAECFLNELLSDLLLLLGGFLLGHPLEVAVWALGFTALRVKLGGYHAPTHFLCITSGTLLGLSSIFVNPLWGRSYLLTGAILLLSLVIVVAIAPVLHVNRPIPVAERSPIKRKAIVTALVIIAAILLFHNVSVVALALTSGLVYAAGLGVIGYFVNPK